MPTRPPHKCNHHGCTKLVTTTYCDQHTPAHPHEDNRVSARERGYTTTWDKLASQHKRLHPLCVRCGAPASVVHHVVPLSEGGARYDPDNLQSLCGDCHNIVHSELRRR